MLPKKSSLAIATFLALILLLELTKFARPFALAGALDFRPRPTATAEEPLRPRPRAGAPVKTQTVGPIWVGPNLIDKSESLKPFYQALWRTEARQPGAVTRVLHYGDSPVTADSITADVRSLLQEHFGDAGHGFVFWSPNPGPGTVTAAWMCKGKAGISRPPRQSRANDGFHGLGGVSFEGERALPRTWCCMKITRAWRFNICASPAADCSRWKRGRSSRPGGNRWNPEKQPAFQTFSLPAGARDIDLSVERGPVRLFGVSFEKMGAGRDLQ
jgi:hypothetical protein